MRLNRLDLELFGHFTGKTFDFGTPQGSDFHVIYGPNEAGKTTFKEGFLRLLYGFPAVEPYAFLHERSALRISGEVALDGVATPLTRISKRAGNLLDATGAPIPDTALARALAGLGEAEYRTLLCLDDKSIDEGGAAIAASEGKVGELLFSAASGLSGVSAVLSTVDADARAFFVKRGSKSAFAEARKRRTDLESQIKEADIGAAAYRKLYSQLEHAQKSETLAATARQAASTAKAEAASLCAALPIKAKLEAAEAALSPLAAYPARLTITPRDVLEMTTKRAALTAKKETTAQEITRLTTERDALPRDPARAAQAGDLADIAPLQARCQHAETDLPKRAEAVEKIRSDMRQGLALIGIDGGSAPERYIPIPADLNALDQLSKAQAKLAQARALADEASRAEAEAVQIFDTARKTLDGLPDTQAVLDAQGADQVAQTLRTSEQRVTDRASAAAQALARLTLGANSYDTLPDITLSETDGRALGERLTKAEEARASCETRHREAETALHKTRARLAILSDAPGIILDTAAAQTREARNEAWAQHQNALTAETAERFAAAMATDDASVAARLASASTSAEIREMRLKEAEMAAELAEAQSALSDAEAATATAQTTFQQALAAAGLPDALSPDRFAEWLRATDAARAALAEAKAAQQVATPTRAAADALRTALCTALGKELPFEQAYALALDAAAARRDHVQAVHLAEANVQKARAETSRLETALQLAKTQVEEAVLACPAPIPDDLETALPVLRDLRELEAKREGFQRQQDGMARDMTDFATRLEALIGPLDHPPLVAYRAWEHAVRTAAQNATIWTEKNNRITDLEAEARDHQAALNTLDAERRALAETFDASIPTGDLTALSDAVGEAERANGIRQQIADLTEAFCTRLGVATRQEGEARLAGQSVDALDAQLGEAETALEVAEAAHLQSVEARVQAEGALAQVTGGDTVARLVSEREVAELEMEKALLAHVELDLGRHLAEEALRRYRDRHRSTMMHAAEAAFTDLTSGAYSRLMTQSQGDQEVLVAIQAATGQAKTVAGTSDAKDQAFSKGTLLQLYLALRAAAYDQMVANGTTLPFLCDDVFETFDEDRTRAACRLLHRIGKKGQAIYLTHHRHVVDIAQEACGPDLRVHTL